ncbi:unnamed protein product [Fusarium fujikuroi]|uniref:Uncharacterized protein n=1 Tax=Fusarium fujikuroi TaxID=5127 RepID=A0A9Q9RWP4_FUSFU|nr:uncharacterized protein FFE2_15966 [Fusarium fujikuroi]SCO54077.1 uncharacterized protein FFNC_15327 [Fusarium fujikuroi]VTT78166.1 unnamed protein product [Fusarium fujikuroi]VZI11136.1 unnamed protein product [Fusarium fujikuroi]
MHSEGHDSSAVRPLGVPLGEAAKPPRFQAYVTGEQPSSNNNIARASLQCNESASSHTTFGVRYAACTPLPNEETSCELSPSKTELLANGRTPGGKNSPPQLWPPCQPNFIPTRSDTPSDETPAQELEITGRGKLETQAAESRKAYCHHPEIATLSGDAKIDTCEETDASEESDTYSDTYEKIDTHHLNLFAMEDYERITPDLQ